MLFVSHSLFKILEKKKISFSGDQNLSHVTDEHVHHFLCIFFRIGAIHTTPTWAAHPKKRITLRMTRSIGSHKTANSPKNTQKFLNLSKFQPLGNVNRTYMLTRTETRSLATTPACNNPCFICPGEWRPAHSSTETKDILLRIQECLPEVMNFFSLWCQKKEFKPAS